MKKGGLVYTLLRGEPLGRPHMFDERLCLFSFDDYDTRRMSEIMSECEKLPRVNLKELMAKMFDEMKDLPPGTPMVVIDSLTQTTAKAPERKSSKKT